MAGVHDGLTNGETVITGLTGIRQRENRLKAIFSDRVHALSDFRPLGFDCPADAFLSFSVIGRALARRHELPGISHGVGKIALKALFRQQPRRLMEYPGEQPILFACLNGGANEGIAIIWLSKSQPCGGDIQSAPDSFECGEVWFGHASLVVRNS